MLTDLKVFCRYAVCLPGFLRAPVSQAQSLSCIRDQRQRRDESFLGLVRDGIYPHPHSPYNRLLSHFGIPYRAIEDWVRSKGIEHALKRLYEAGVYISLDEFKFRVPIRRGNLTIECDNDAFDNPLRPAHFVGTGRGSRTMTKRNKLDLNLLSHEAGYYLQLLKAFDLLDRPIATWRSVPPDISGISVALRLAKIAQPLRKWFSPRPVKVFSPDWKFALFMRYTLAASRLSTCPLPAPEHVPLDEAVVVASWLADQKLRGQTAVLNTPASSGVRVCLAAKKHDLDIAGSFFLLTGEPYTAAKSQVIMDCGCRAVALYHSSEAGVLGIPCVNPRAIDDVHLVSDKAAFVGRSHRVRGTEVEGLALTTLMTSCPRIMLNVETDDYGYSYYDQCGCAIGQLGFAQKMHSIRSYEKLTSEGMNFVGTELIQLLEDVLPARFGGQPIDYQLLEVEENGLTKVKLVIEPEVGALDEALVIQTCIDFLRRVPGGESMTDIWRQGDTLQVVRRPPYTTSSSKILPIHVLKERGVSSADHG